MPDPLNRTQYKDSGNQIRARLLCHHKISHNPPDRNGMYLGKMRISTFQLSFICVGVCLCAVWSSCVHSFTLVSLRQACSVVSACETVVAESLKFVYIEFVKFSPNAVTVDDVMGFLLTECALIDRCSNRVTFIAVAGIVLLRHRNILL